ncbi:FUN14 domain-containing protein 1-like [Branchiostoma floridae x Branchiostoma japonicum]
MSLPGSAPKMAERQQNGEERDEGFEILDLAEARRRGWLKDMFPKDLSAKSVGTQIAVGGVSGWCAGYLFSKVGKLAATAVGGGFLLLQIANHAGYVKINWKRVEKDMEKYKKEIGKQAEKAYPDVAQILQQAKTFMQENMVVAGGFAGGFLIGLAS